MDDEIGGVPRLRGDGRPERDRNASDAVEGGEENCEGLRRGRVLHSTAVATFILIYSLLHVNRVYALTSGCLNSIVAILLTFTVIYNHLWLITIELGFIDRININA